MSACSNGGPRGQKQNNRRYPGIKGRRPDNKVARKEVAASNKKLYDGLSLDEKKAINPKRYEEAA